MADEYFDFLREVLDSGFEEELVFITGDVFGDVCSSAFGMAHFSQLDTPDDYKLIT